MAVKDFQAYWETTKVFLTLTGRSALLEIKPYFELLFKTGYLEGYRKHEEEVNVND